MTIAAAWWLGLSAGYLLGALFNILWSERSWRREAVRRGFAEYDSITGKWKWKEPPNANRG